MATAIPPKAPTRILSRLFGRSRDGTGEELVGPIRGEVLGAERLGERARAVARGHHLLPAQKQRGVGPLLLRLEDTRNVLDRVYHELNTGAERGLDISPAGDWLLDNFYIVQEHIREIRTNLPKGYYEELPKLATGSLTGYPRAYEVAIELIAHSEGHLDLDNITLFLREYQTVTALRMGELWAIPTMLRLGLVENIRRMALRVAARLQEVESADRAATALREASEESQQALAAALAAFVDNHPPFSPTWVARFLQQVRSYQTNFTPLIWLEQWIAEDGPSAEEAATRSNRRVALTQVTVANSITSLRTISRLDWKDFVESQSATEKILRQDRSGHYPSMTFGTRDHYRHIVEHIAKRVKRPEEEIASEALALAKLADPTDARHAHVGYFLVEKGRAVLEEKVGYTPPPGEWLYRWIQRHPNTLYFGGITLFTTLALAAILEVVESAPATIQVIIALVSLIPASEIGISIINQMIILLMPPRLMSKLELRDDGIPEEYMTAVVVPTLLGSVHGVEEALEHIEVQYLANRDLNLQFAILSDFTDSPTEHSPDDEEILAAAATGIKALNARYGLAGEDVFFLFHRPRLWNPKQGVWMGWERKRGKLAQFNRFLRGGAIDAFSTVVGDTSRLGFVRYVITLDSDTVLPRDVARLLVGTIAHPLNRAQYDSKVGRVTQGYGIIQPRVGVSLTSAHRSYFAAIHSGHPGVDPYTTAVSDVYQDLYGEGSFTGKGIYDVDAFEEATHGRFPENTLLSHDLIEGTWTRAGLATDIEVYDDYPARYLTFTRRKHRWIRGDWQLLGWLKGTVPGPDGPMRNRLSALSRWKIFDNLRRSLVEIAQLAMLVTGWFLLPGSVIKWTAIVLVTIAFPWLFSLMISLLRPPRDQSWLAYYLAVGRDAITNTQQFALAVVFLPHQAVVSADAIIRTLYRLLISHRKLLEWQTASQVERTMGIGSQLETWRKMWAVTALCLVLGALIGLHVTVGGAYTSDERFLFVMGTLTLALVWLASPSIAFALSHPAILGELHLTEAERQASLRYAKLHWMYFEKFVTEETQWLAPDNFQEDPEPILALRTSPTNIGLQLLSTVSAVDLGFITRSDMIDRVEKVFRSLERMRRLHGHFFNWYDLNELRVLEPAYVSTVDSGNFAGHLIALKQACYEMMKDPSCPANDTKRLRAIAERAHAYAVEMDFRFLYDNKRKLFTIGYHLGSNTVDNSYYDLLASESRLASFIAVAKDDVSVDHWFRLGRSLTAAAGTRTLLSWSGSMFEYLMPALVMQTFPFTLLDQTHKGSVKRQIAYGAERGVPWGVSESAYAVRDRLHTYQYRGFGVPDLALKRGLSKELVVAPYATVLAMLVEPRQALKNLTTLEAEGALGPYGFRDALDYTRPSPGSRKTIVCTFMAHHIGMSIVALNNALNRQIWPRRFHLDPLVRSAELVLQERIPRRLTVQDVQGDDAARVPSEMEKPAVREIETPHTPQPVVGILGNVPYTTLITNAGGGFSRYGNLAVTRWRHDSTRDNYGQWCYVKDLSTGHVWSTAHQPSGTEPQWYRVLFASDRITFIRRDGDIDTVTEIAVASDDAAEVRRVILTNRALQSREIELTSYSEVVLAPPDADRAHPAFQNLFVQTEFLEGKTALLATRRPRSATEAAIWCAHVVACGPEAVGKVTCETDRARFVGRGRSVRNAAALDEGAELTGTVGAVLDPIFSLRVRVRIPAGASAHVAFTTFVTEQKERAIELADLYHDPYSARRALDLSWAQAQAELRDLGIAPADAALYQDLAGHLMFPHPGFRPAQSAVEENRLGQQALWTLGVSGDWPILLATIDSPVGMPSVRQLLRTHHYWRLKGITCDLVILNMHPASYMQELSDDLLATSMASSEAGLLDRPGGVFVRRADLLKPEEITLLQAMARVQVNCDGLGLGNFLEFPGVEDRYPPKLEIMNRDIVPLGTVPIHAATADPGTGLQSFNGLGGFNDGGEYEIHLTGSDLPPAPWINVVGNPVAGFVVSEGGSGTTWASNSFFYRLTPWHNDPVRDPSSDCVFLRDDTNGDLWTATPCPIREPTPYRVRHGAGYSVFDHDHKGIASSLRLGVDQSDPVKISVLTLRNDGATRKKLTLTWYLEWVLGVTREKTQYQVRTSFDEQTQSMFARNYFDADFAENVAFASISERVAYYTADRREFLGRNGTISSPAALERAGLSGAIGATIDPCCALQVSVTLDPGEKRDIVMLLGAAESEDAVRQIIGRHRTSAAAKQAVSANTEAWEKRLATIRVRTPEPTFDLMVNRWALYQALSCRMWARSALYQSSGAFGFRDQLQDVMAFVYSDPEVAREHIVRSASRQFVEGDVQHWWHPQTGRGVRTRFSDDLVWLPYVIDHYVTVASDQEIFDIEVPYLTMRQLNPDEHEIYDMPKVSSETGSIYDHCVRALRRACTKGVHGLPLIGSGDWNDGMNRVGIEGKGESVWLAWFLIATLRKFAAHAERRGDAAMRDDVLAKADGYAEAVERSAWDGEWYRRAYFDDGSSLGSRNSDECKIDSIAQSWSVISGAGKPERTRIAMQSLNKYLVQEDARIISLLTPPFDKTPHDPGYIQGYLPGVRENGAQYTHAALWAVLATALQGDGNRAFELFQMLNPITHADSPNAVDVYKVEPYVVAADVYTAQGHLGRGGWTWYTGSASWMYRVALESILGFQQRGEMLFVEPCIPASWKEFTIEYRFGASTYEITVENPDGLQRGAVELTEDGNAAEKAIRLVDDGKHHRVTASLRSSPSSVQSHQAKALR
ncbi:MAG: carbohydrate-binding protein [Gemmatimonadota bacterium]|nr:carbohydrate-binding protein [Gemmatimonadota bacterium]